MGGATQSGGGPTKEGHNPIAYHKVREAIAAGVIRVAKEGVSTNIAGIFTKLMPHGKLMGLASMRVGGQLVVRCEQNVRWIILGLRG